ncbi:D site albumin promoter binding protein b isoform X2 [Engraulis encrasicolus]|uniref:D site albumin promoter binding protein b isoform X2 n=1 Tax=Engraulis encrasicolus TaxID=184585 RepID=UPI002FD2F5D0
MSRQISQILPPDTHHAPGASPQFGSCSQFSYSHSNGHFHSGINLKTHSVKSDPRKDTEMKDKDRTLDLDEDSMGRCSMRSSSTSSSNGSGPNSNNNNGGSSGSEGSGNSNGSFSNSGFLGPLMWERSMPSDGGLFQLQYMDLEEFLTENGMGSGNGCSSSAAQVPSHNSQSAVPNQSSQCPTTSPLPCSSASSVSSTSSSASSSPTLLGLDNMQGPPGLLGAPDCLHGGHGGNMDPNLSPSPSSCGPMTTPASTDGSDIMGSFDTDQGDLALATVPGQDAFDPHSHRFSEDELKPQPMIKKARKMMVPEDLKDDKYWSRRHKNNEAAKRSRDARRLKENQIAVRASFLERENQALRQEVADMRKELSRCRNLLNKYEEQ